MIDDSIKWDGYDTYPPGWTQSEANMLQCGICKHRCKIPEGGLGKCRVIRNSSHELSYQYVGYSNISVDHIEKRPFFHYAPGAKCLSAGYFGCNFVCHFCQNYPISQDLTGLVQRRDLVATAKSVGADVIAFTFNEPTIYYRDIISVAERSPYPVVVKTNGFATDEVWKDLSPHVAAYNVDIKGTEEDYQAYGGSLHSVMQSVENLVALGHHVEISYLVTVGSLKKNDFHTEMAKWIVSLGRIPVHILYLYPCHLLSTSYAVYDIFGVWDIFKAHIDFVYVSNLFDGQYAPFRNSYCPICHDLMISRSGGIIVHKLTCCGHGL